LDQDKDVRDRNNFKVKRRKNGGISQRDGGGRWEGASPGKGSCPKDTTDQRRTTTRVVGGDKRTHKSRCAAPLKGRLGRRKSKTRGGGLV